MAQPASTHLSLALQSVLSTYGEDAARQLFDHEVQHHRTRKELTEAIYAQLVRLPEPDKGTFTLKLKRLFKGARIINIAVNT